MTTESISVVSSNSAGRVNLAPRPLPSSTHNKHTMSSDNVTPQQGSTTRYGDHHKQQQHHQETLVIKSKIGTAWHYRFCTTHEDNYDDNDTNHINNLQTIYTTINNNTNDIYILHQQTKTTLTTDMIQNATNVMDICTNATTNTSTSKTTYRICVHSTTAPNMKLSNPLKSIQGKLPTNISYHLDDFRGHPTKLLGIIVNEEPSSVGRRNTKNVINNELITTNNKQSTHT